MGPDATQRSRRDLDPRHADLEAGYFHQQLVSAALTHLTCYTPTHLTHHVLVGHLALLTDLLVAIHTSHASGVRLTPTVNFNAPNTLASRFSLPWKHTSHVSHFKLTTPISHLVLFSIFTHKHHTQDAQQRTCTTVNVHRTPYTPSLLHSPDTHRNLNTPHTPQTSHTPHSSNTPLLFCVPSIHIQIWRRDINTNKHCTLHVRTFALFFTHSGTPLFVHGLREEKPDQHTLKDGGASITEQDKRLSRQNATQILSSDLFCSAFVSAASILA